MRCLQALSWDEVVVVELNTRQRSLAALNGVQKQRHMFTTLLNAPPPSPACQLQPARIGDKPANQQVDTNLSAK
jgi:hypothetical protein